MAQTHTQILEELAQAADEVLLDWVKKGKPDRDLEGREIRRPLTAAEMTAVVKRLKDCNITAVVRPGSTLGQLAEALEDQGEAAYRFPTLPPIAGDDEDDAATAAG